MQQKMHKRSKFQQRTFKISIFQYHSDSRSSSSDCVVGLRAPVVYLEEGDTTALIPKFEVA
ncbi:hypothetical protein Hanom_Chr04g00362781 [Helianthus anomalus]